MTVIVIQPTGGTVLPSLTFRPETYGAGFNGSASDDWGPAITQAWVDAQMNRGYLQLTSTVYGIRTTIASPSVPTNAALAPIIGIPGSGDLGGTVIKKLADVTLLNATASDSLVVGTGVGNGSLFHGIQFNGGNNTNWHTPLMTCFNMENHQCNKLSFSENYGPAFTVRGCWDWRWNDVSVLFCGATDGVNPAILLFSNSGDGGDSTNNQWFHQLRVEDFRTGALWAIGATTNDRVSLVRLTGSTKIEISNGFLTYGPFIKLQFMDFYSQDVATMTHVGTKATTQSTPYDVFMYIGASRYVDLGEIYASVSGGTGTNFRSLFYIDEATAAVQKLSYNNIVINAADAPSQPTTIFQWNSVSSPMARGMCRIQGSLWSTVSMDSGSDPPLVNLPTLAGATDTTYKAFESPVRNGNQAWDSNLSTIQTRIGGTWFPVGQPPTYLFTSSASTVVPTTMRTVGVSRAGAVALTIPTPNTVPAGMNLAIHDESGAASTNNITVTPATGTIDGSANKVINTNFGSLWLYSDGNTNWRVIASR